MNVIINKKMNNSKNIEDDKDMNVVKFPQYLNASKVWSNNDYNLVSVKGGKYSVDKNMFLSKYDKEIKDGATYHLAEKITKDGLTQLRCDIDHKIEVPKGTKPYNLLNDNIILNIIKKYYEIFESYGCGITEEQYQCVILRKNPYVKEDVKPNKTTYWLKHGFHLQFPTVYLSYDNSKKVAEYMRDEFPDYVDYNAGFSNAWLLYGSCKDERYGTYVATDVVGSDLVKKPFIPPEDTNLAEYFSVVGNKNKVKYWCNINLPEKEVSVEMSKCKNAISPHEGAIQEMVNGWLEENVLDDCLRIGDWSPNKPFLNLVKTNDYSCPCNPDYLHAGRGAYVYVDKSGSVFYKCYRKECCAVKKNIHIGVCEECKVEETSETSETELDLDCKEAFKIYKSNPESKNAKYNGMSYGDICEKDSKFANWCCDKNIIPHDYYFSRVLKREYVEKPISLDNIKPDKVIDTNNIGTYDFTGVDTVFLRSNMMTRKTQSLKTILDGYEKIVFISFRRSLSNEMNSQFSEYGFVSYEDVDGSIYDKRVIIQIDSLHRIRGKYDLIIMDEAVYTLNHLVSFCKEKSIITETLASLYQNCKNTIVCDALLDNKTINYIKALDTGKKCKIIENTYKPFTHKNVRYCSVNIHEHNKILLHIGNMIKEHGKLYIPTNSQRFGEKVYDYYKNEYNILLIDKNTEYIPCSSTWKNYDMVICSPTIGAGISCNDEFGKTICYFSNNSCDASLSAQQILRVRNTTCDTLDIFICETFRECIPTNVASIKEMIQTKYSLDITLGLKVNRVDDTIIEDDYHNYFVEYIRSNNISKICFKRVLDGILINHGFSTSSFELEEEDDDVLKSLKATIKEQKLERDNDTTITMLESDIISEDEYIKINKKQKKTKDDRSKLEKYNLIKAYGHDGFTKLLEENCLKTTRAFVKDIYKYKNLCLLKNEEVEEAIKGEIQYNDGLERIHENKKACKIFIAYKMIEILGFNSVFDTSIKSSLDYGNMLEWLKKWNYKVRTLWNESDKEDFSEYDIDSEDLDKRSRSRKNTLERYNAILNKVLGVRVRDGNTKHNGRNGKCNYKYKIYGIEKYDLIGGVKSIIPKIQHNPVVEVYEGKCGNPMLEFYDEDDILVC